MQSGWALGYILAALMAAFILEPSAARRRRVALAVRRGRPAGAVRHLDPPQRSRAAGMGRARKTRRTTSGNPFAVMFGPAMIGRTMRVVAARFGGGSSRTGASSSGCPPSFAPVEQGGAGMGVVGSLGWLIPVQIGAYLGYLTFGFIADRLGRRAAFVLFMLGAAVLVPSTGRWREAHRFCCFWGPCSAISATATSACSAVSSRSCFRRPCAQPVRARYNIGRMAGAAAPYTIGKLATLPGIGIGIALASTSAFFLLAALLVFALPDRSGQDLDPVST